jgi:hypothetical protein
VRSVLKLVRHRGRGDSRFGCDYAALSDPAGKLPGFHAQDLRPRYPGSLAFGYARRLLSPQF